MQLFSILNMLTYFVYALWVLKSKQCNGLNSNSNTHGRIAGGLTFLRNVVRGKERLTDGWDPIGHDE